MKTVRDEFKESDMVSNGNRRIARETSDSAYSWDNERSRKTEMVDDGNSLECI